MKPKNQIAMSAILIMAIADTTTMHAQGAYIGFGGGYHIATASQSLATSNTSSTSEIKLVKGTFGKGIMPSLFFGTMLNTNVGIELGVGYLLGSKIKSSYSSSYGTSNYEGSVKAYQLIPTLRICTTAEKVKLYSKSGVVICIAGNFTEMEKYTSIFQGSTSMTEETIRKYTGGISIGFIGAAGGQFKISEKCSFFSEISFIAQSWAPSKGKTTSYIVNGQDELASLSAEEKETEFVSSISGTPPGSGKSLKTYIPLSSVGINVGIQFALAKKAK